MMLFISFGYVASYGRMMCEWYSGKDTEESSFKVIYMLFMLLCGRIEENLRKSKIQWPVLGAWFDSRTSLKHRMCATLFNLIFIVVYILLSG
jgi:hypothetical protein